MVNKERIRLWVDALRSGEYRQGFGMLSKDDNYCCLGVACEVAIKNGLDINVELLFPSRVEYDGESARLPISVQEWFGFDNEDPLLIGDKATVLNDEVRLDFNAIANDVERTYLDRE